MGYVPSAAVAVEGEESALEGCLPRGSARGSLLRGSLPRGCLAMGVSAWGCLPRGCLPRGVYTNSPVDGILDTCKNITFPQLLLWTVTNCVNVCFK